MNVEIWKDIEGYKGLYQVSSFGRVKTLRRVYYSGMHNSEKIQEERIMSPVTHKTTMYQYVGFSVNGVKSKHAVHRLVALAFVPNPENKQEVNHINGVKADNRADNLEWVTREENIQHAFRSGIIKHTSDVAIIQLTMSGEFVKEYDSIESASRETGVNSGNIGSCCRCVRGYSHAGGFIWKYK